MSNFDLDNAALADYLTGRIPGLRAPITTDKFSDGQSNPTYRVRSGDQCWVLRRKPPGELLKSAHAVDREFRVMSALAESAVPVPAMHLLCEDPAVIGSSFYVMEHLDGRIFWDPALPDLLPEQRGQLYEQMNRVLAALHSIRPDDIGLGDFGRPGNYFQRQLARWSKQYRLSEPDTDPAMEALIGWLETHLPPDDGQVALVHGDYRMDNMMLAKDRLEIIGLLDWELSTLGHPYADLAYQCMQWRLPADAAIPGFGSRDRATLGIPTEAEYVQRYCQHRQISDIDHWTFYLAFSFFRFSAILFGVRRRAMDGNASSTKAQAYGNLAAPLAAMGLDVTQQQA